MGMEIAKLSPNTRKRLDRAVVVGSVLVCLLLSLVRLPGMELLGIAPNWLLIWLVSWSVKRSVWQGAIAGIVLGLIQDGMTSPAFSHVLSFVIVGVLTAQIQKQRYIQEDFISVALIVFAMALLLESVTAIQYGAREIRSFDEIWLDYQQIALTSAILSSLWTPVLYYPLNRWWETLKTLEQSS